MARASKGSLKTSNGGPQIKMSDKDYLKELRKLQVELCRVQDWVKANGKRIIVVFEGRDGAGKGQGNQRLGGGGSCSCPLSPMRSASCTSVGKLSTTVWRSRKAQLTARIVSCRAERGV